MICKILLAGSKKSMKQRRPSPLYCLSTTLKSCHKTVAAVTVKGRYRVDKVLWIQLSKDSASWGRKKNQHVSSDKAKFSIASRRTQPHQGKTSYNTVGTYAWSRPVISVSFQECSDVWSGESDQNILQPTSTKSQIRIKCKVIVLICCTNLCIRFFMSQITVVL